MRTKILSLLLLLLSFAGISQNLQIDSLNSELQTSKESGQSRLCNMLAYEWVYYNLDSSYYYAQRALALAREHNQSKEEAQAWFSIGYYYELKEDYFQALEAYNKSFFLYQELNEINSMASLASYIGSIYKTTGVYDLAARYFHLSLDLYFKSKDYEGLTYSYNNLGTLYYKTGANEKAVDAFAKSLKYAKILKDTLSMASIYNNLGLISMRMNDLERAFELFNLSLDLSKDINEITGIAIAYSNIADVYMAKGEYDVALNYLDLVDNNFGLEFNASRSANNLLNMAQIYDKMMQPVSAEEYFVEAMNYAQEKNLKPELENIYKDFASFLSRNNRHSEANALLFSLVELKDSMYKEEVCRQMANANMRVSLAEKNIENIELTKENEFSELRLKQWRTSGIISLTALIIILFLLILINSRVINLKRQKRALEEKNNEIEGLNIRMNNLHEQLSQNMTHRTMQLDSEREKRYEAEKNLQKIHGELKNLQELKNQYVVHLNGEIRSSLNVIIGFSKLLEDKPDEDTHSYASYISNNAEHIYLALQNMLAFEMIEKNSIILNKSEFSLFDFRNQSAAYLNKLLPNLVLKEDAHFSLSDRVIVSDRDLLMKLIIDGIKFLYRIALDSTVYVDGNSNDKSLQIRFYSHVGQTQISTISKLLSIEDAVDIKSLSREDAFLYSSLFFIRSLIKAFDSNISLQIEDNKLAIRYILPFQNENELIETPKPDKNLCFAILQGSDRISTILLQKKLEEKGTVKVFEDISFTHTDNLKVMENMDMVFLDIPSEDIYDWAQALKKIPNKEKLPPVVAVSAYLTQEDIDLLLNAGFSFYLNKPLKSAYLYKIIDKMRRYS